MQKNKLQFTKITTNKKTIQKTQPKYKKYDIEYG